MTGALEPRKEVKDFAMAMEEKLQKNDHRPHWRGDSIQYLLGRMNDEWNELGDALKGEGDPREELIDIANFAMMLWHRLSYE